MPLTKEQQFNNKWKKVANDLVRGLPMDRFTAWISPGWYIEMKTAFLNAVPLVSRLLYYPIGTFAFADQAETDAMYFFSEMLYQYANGQPITFQELIPQPPPEPPVIPPADFSAPQRQQEIIKGIEAYNNFINILYQLHVANIPPLASTQETPRITPFGTVLQLVPVTAEQWLALSLIFINWMRSSPGTGSQTLP